MHANYEWNVAIIIYSLNNGVEEQPQPRFNQALYFPNKKDRQQ